ncbi:OmpL47-type beta-barrel domain-containing protein [Paenibacillus sp.]|uniref:OmpL47-type beta-barrel domain-containing protein n=1 Tax=Paenibacillus sp. TaxID=58172 RepID=UPI002D71EB91|nr:pectinesterase [Paenibacillus sp.]HZG86924.1 pectinesterase [Paenibacillus sp.]
MKKFFLILLTLALCGSLFPLSPSVSRAGYDALPAFPGAEGFGYAAKGGRGGEVYHVTSYELTGPGTFHDALTTAGSVPRTIVFDISGDITIPQIIVRNKSNITIAGQTAPGEGVTIRGNNIRFINCQDIVIRYLRFRLGTQSFNDDTMYFEDCQNVIVDHSSFSWGTDEVLSVKSKDYERPLSKNITVQWSVIAEGLLTHSMGGLIEMNTITMHHNLYAHNNDRNPKTKGQIDFVNNIVYNWGGYPYVAGGESGTKGYGNVVGNYFIAGINSANPQYAVVRGNENYSLYLDNNRIDSNKNGVLDGTDTGAGMMEAERPSVLVPERFEYPPVHTQEPEAAYEYILDHAGASLARDAVDVRIVDSVRTQTGAIIGHENDVGGFPELPRATAPADTDRDGMPDAWELSQGLDPNDAADRNGDADGDGYTNLEEYLNALAAPGFPAGYPMTPVPWDGDPFVPPVVPAPAPEPEPVPSMDGELLRNVVVNDNSGSGDANEKHWSVQSNLQVGDFVAGDRMTGDRAYRFVTIPSELLGTEWIRSAVGSRSASNPDVVSFHLAADADVYVAHDARITTKPQWLTSAYENTGEVIVDSQPVQFQLFKRRFEAGSHVVMGPNHNSSRMNYFVVVKPASPETPPPSAAPETVTAAFDADGGAAELAWTPAEGADAYLVYRSSTLDAIPKVVGSSEAPQFTDTSVVRGVTYRYIVTAVNDGGESAASGAVELPTYDPSVPPPEAPAGLEAEAAGSLFVSLRWPAASEGVIAYRVYRAEHPDGPYVPIGVDFNGIYTDKTVMPETAYFYRVTAMGAGGESAPSDSIPATTKPPVAFPAPPAGLASESATTSAFELSWNAVPEAESYNVYRKGYEEGGYTKVGTVRTASFVDDGISAGRTGYSYHVTAVNEMGESAPSEAVSIDMPLPAQPTGLVVGLAGETFVGLIWTSHGASTQYNIYRESEEEPLRYVGYAKVDTFYDRTVEPGTEYTYYVRAANARGESALSDGVTVKTLGAPADETPPVTTADAKEGWQTEAQTVRFHAVDAEGSETTTFYSVDGGPFVEGNEVVIDGDGVHALRYYSVDAAGNQEAERTAEVRIDRTGPVVEPSVTLVVYRHESASLSFLVTDALSGPAGATAALDGTEVALPIAIEPYALPLGEHEIVVVAADVAGNAAERRFALTVTTDAEALDEALLAAFERGWIANEGVLNSLLAKAERARDGGAAERSRALEALENEAAALAGKQLDAAFAAHLLEDLAYLKRQ